MVHVRKNKNKNHVNKSYKNRIDGAEIPCAPPHPGPGSHALRPMLSLKQEDFSASFFVLSFFLPVAGSTEGGQESKQERE